MSGIDATMEILNQRLKERTGGETPRDHVENMKGVEPEGF